MTSCMNTLVERFTNVIERKRVNVCFNYPEIYIGAAVAHDGGDAPPGGGGL